VGLGRKQLNVSRLLLGVCLLCVSIVRGQSGTTLEGTVFDASGAPIPGADVTLFSDERVLTTKANEAGIFRFASLPSGLRHVEATSNGFASVSIPMSDEPLEGLSFVLEPGSSSGVTPICPPPRPNNLPLPSASYEARREIVQLIGTVSDPAGVPQPNASLTLLRADPDVLLGKGRARAMRARAFKETVVAEVSPNEKGEFRFSDLEPGWYALRATREGYSSEYVQFWVARETLTRLSRLYLSPLPNCR
jgi:protocatechuate 3,4-dioxygenase beta subunit